ncbi:hypothetical protein JCM33774_29250 [Actinophytocola sp. KF-1]
MGRRGRAARPRRHGTVMKGSFRTCGRTPSSRGARRRESFPDSERAEGFLSCRPREKRSNAAQTMLADWFGISQATVSRVYWAMLPLLARVTCLYRPPLPRCRPGGW